MDDSSKYEKNAVSYDRIVEKWNDFRKNCKINKCVEEFVILLKKGASILDVGCGTGYPISDYLSKNSFKVTGIDPSEKMLEKARALDPENAQFIKSDFLSFKTDEKFDAIIAFDSLWYIPVEKQPLIYKKASSLLNRGGYFMFTHGDEHGETQGEMFGETFYYAALSSQEITALLQENGFKVVRMQKDYKEPTTGTRDLLVFAKKTI